MKQKRPGLREYEYWPYWFFYSAFVPYWLKNSIKARSLSYFCRVNPGIRFGGFLDYSKYEVLKRVPEDFKPETQFLKHKSDLASPSKFPFIVKPDFGERGRYVELIRNKKDWKNYPIKQNIIIQEYVDLPYEFGLFYIKFPNWDSGKILSITGKEFLTFIGDGKSSLKDFIESEKRVHKRIAYFKERFGNEWNKTQKEGKTILLEPVGNHNRGTRFYDASHLITEKLSETLTRIANEINGFYYGRFDVKSKSEEDLKNGKFIILEINGANSEPTHIYDSKYNLKQAKKEIKRHFDLQYKIAVENPKTYSSADFYKAVFKRFF